MTSEPTPHKIHPDTARFFLKRPDLALRMASMTAVQVREWADWDTDNAFAILMEWQRPVTADLPRSVHTQLKQAPHIGAAIRILRECGIMTAAELASSVGMSHEDYEHFEAGQIEAAIAAVPTMLAVLQIPNYSLTSEIINAHIPKPQNEAVVPELPGAKAGSVLDKDLEAQLKAVPHAGAAVRILCERAGPQFDHAYMAAQTGIDRSNYTSFVNGKRPYNRDFIARALKVLNIAEDSPIAAIVFEVHRKQKFLLRTHIDTSPREITADTPINEAFQILRGRKYLTKPQAAKQSGVPLGTYLSLDYKSGSRKDLIVPSLDRTLAIATALSATPGELEIIKAHYAERRKVLLKKARRNYNTSLTEDTLPGRMRSIRTGAGDSQQEAADKIGVDVVTYRTWEGGKNLPYRSNILKFVQVYELDDMATRHLLHLREEWKAHLVAKSNEAAPER